MSEHELLLRHTETWASARNRALDSHLLAAALEVWTSHEGHTELEWPAGSAERLLLQQWPHHRPIADADIGTLVESLETFWRFLRATGRLRSGSAEPKDLVKEARRAAPKVPVAHHQPTAPVSVQEALTEWDLDSGDDAYDDDGFDDYFKEDFEDTHEETWALVPGRLPKWERDPAVEDSAREVRQSPFVLECLRFARWIGDEKRITNGVLCPAQVRQAQVEFNLEAWERQFLARSPLKSPGSLNSQAFLGGIPDGALGGLDHLITTRALQSLWGACLSAGLIEIGSTTVRATSTADPRHELTEDDWIEIGQRAVASAVVTRHFLEPMDPVLRVLLPFLRKGVGHVEESEVLDWWWGHEANPWTHLGLQITMARRSSDRQALRLLWSMDDMGTWRREGQTLHRTALGMDVAMLFVEELPELLHAG